MRLAVLLLAVAALAPAALAQSGPKPEAVWGDGAAEVKIATGSPGELGLLEALSRDFAQRENARVVWFKAGSGAAMKLLQERHVDMALAHAPPAERKAVADGWATGRAIFGANEFWIVGPKDDPAKIAGKSAEDAFRAIAAAKARFVSRGDNSGTHQKELEIWKLAGVAPAPEQVIVTKDFMAASLRRADKEGAYFLTDSSTFVAERANTPGLTILARGGASLFNPYHTLRLTTPTPGAETAQRFAAYLLGERAQALLRDYGKTQFGEAMYFDAAAARRQWPADQ